MIPASSNFTAPFDVFGLSSSTIAEAMPAAGPKSGGPALDGFLRRLQKSAYEELDCAGYSADLQGWIDDKFESRLRDIFRQAPLGRPIRMLEVGSWKGLSSSFLGSLAKERDDGSFLLCIDTWLGAPEFWTSAGLDDPTRGGSLGFRNGYPSVFYTFTRNIKSRGLDRHVIPFPISSDQGFDVLRHYGAQFDLIYVDAAHEEAPVYRDLQNAWDLLAPGGILFGDDYQPYWAGVVAAVNRFVKEQGVQGVNEGVLWFVPKPQEA